LFKRQSSKGESITIVKPGSQRRDFTYIDDVVEAMDGFDDEDYINRIKYKKIHEKYEVSNKAINKSLKNCIFLPSGESFKSTFFLPLTA